MFETIPIFCPLCGSFLTIPKDNIKRCFCEKCIGPDKGFNCGENQFFIRLSNSIYVRYVFLTDKINCLLIYFKNKSYKIQLPIPNYDLNYSNIIEFLEKKIATIQLLE
jgi:hypothetical protein